MFYDILQGNNTIYMHTFLIIGGTKEERTEKIASLLATENISPFDTRQLVLTDDALSLGISLVRSWQKQLLLMPQHSPLAAGVIESADLLTVEAQNALLKTLEEPPTHTHIYMEAQSDIAFLQTVLSRCSVIRLKDTKTTMSQKDEEMVTTLQQLIDTTTTSGHVLQTIDEKIKNKADAQQWIEDALIIVKKTKTRWTPAVYGMLQKRFLDARKQLRANVSYKLVLDAVFLSFTTRQS